MLNDLKTKLLQKIVAEVDVAEELGKGPVEVTEDETGSNYRF